MQKLIYPVVEDCLALNSYKDKSKGKVYIKISGLIIETSNLNGFKIL
jgi:hypothetical protein